MTAIERRLHPRVYPQGLRAKIFLETASDPINLEGDVLDISLTGIKIKLDKPSEDLDGKIKIALSLPDTGIPLTITGILKHQANASELGLHYVDNPDVDSLDRLLFECTKLAKH
ncbi:hypothetical protein MCAMS1_02330 [biofilm metagenome]